MAQNASAPVMDRMHPEILIRNLDMRISRSAALFDPAVDYAWCGC
jgi:hypothetical protein